MRLPHSVQVISIEKQYDADYGYEIGEVETVTNQFNAEVQPFSSNLAEKQYGVTVNVTNRMYCKPQSLELGAMVKCNNKKYLVSSILDYEKHYEVLLEVKP